ncbi:MAG: EAL domain-containing protein [Sedimenticolaceae bacterium]
MFDPPTRLRNIVGALLSAMLVIGAYLLSTGTALQRVDFLFYDYLLAWREHRISDQVVVVAIDDDSLKRIGRWPWSRRTHAELLDRLTAMRARAVGFDVLFAEQQTDDPLADDLFAGAIARNGKTVLAVAPSNPASGRSITEVLPMPLLAESAAGLGHVDIELDTDGLCRSFYLRAGLGEAHWPAFSLAVLKAASGLEKVARFDVTPTVRQGSGWVRDGRYFLPFDPRPGAVQTLSYDSVMKDDGLANQIAGKYVLVGSTATGLGDFVATPVSFDHQRMPGVELNANILSGLLSGRLARQIGQGPYQILTVCIASIAAVLMVSISFPVGLLLIPTAVAGILALSAVLLYGWQLWFPPAAAIAPIIAGLPLWGAWSLLQERKINRSLTVRMQHQALHHAITDLPNQYVLEARLRRLNPGRIEGGGVAALMIAHIKWYGSTEAIVGRSAGDQLLRAIAKRLSNAVGSDDLVAHLSSDDFGILVEELTDVDSAVRISQNVLNLLQKPIDLDGAQISLSPRMGLSLWPKDSPDGSALLRDAYIAMFRARIEASNTTCVYSDEIAQEVHARSRLEQALITAMERGEFEVYYQPQVVSADGRIIGVEALLRWHNPELGLVYPGTFIPVAEHNGLIQAIGGWVLRTACHQVQQWKLQGLGALRLAVNLSPLQFADVNIVSEVSRALTKSGLDARSLELEITETALMQDLEQATTLMRQLKERGVKLAIDDFGTGYSSLSNLRHFPLDRIKIDQSFVREIHSNREVREITQTIITMAKRLRLDVIAEGVETASQASFLGQNGCDELQGFFFGHPLPALEMTALLQARSGQGPASTVPSTGVHDPV